MAESILFFFVTKPSNRLTNIIFTAQKPNFLSRILHLPEPKSDFASADKNPVKKANETRVFTGQVCPKPLDTINVHLIIRIQHGIVNPLAFQ